MPTVTCSFLAVLSLSVVSSRKHQLVLSLRLLLMLTALLFFTSLCTSRTFAVPISQRSVVIAAAGDLIVSEFRLRGSNGANDEFVEIYNATGVPHTVGSVDGSSGYALAASDGVIRFVIPNGIVIPTRGHYLAVNSVGYSLAGYPAGSGTTATGDVTYATNIADNAGIALFATSTTANFNLANRLDAVGSTSEANTLYKEGTGYPALTPFSIDYSFYRDLLGGSPKDTDNNAADFLFVDTNGTSAGAGQRLGAPGPENLGSPSGENLAANLAVSLLDPSAQVMATPNLVRNATSDPANNSTFGTLSIRRKFTNIGSQPITHLRFRITDLTTFPSPSGIADLRPRTSSNTSVVVGGVPTTVYGTTLEQPPSQPNGGGFNSSMSVNVVTLAAPLAPGASINVQLLLGIQQTGCERVELDTPINYDTCTTGAQIAASKLTCTSFTAVGTGTPASGFAAMRVWNVTTDTVALIDSYFNAGLPTSYAPIAANGSYSATATFPRQPLGAVLRGRIYRASAASFGSWDSGSFQDILATCNTIQVYLPLTQR
jgi:hypothetical protein